MDSEVYVGNYPPSYTRDQLLNLFQDYKGIKLLRDSNTNDKCFAFFRCVDVHQVADMVTRMHDIYISGRNLIVRATNDKLQSHILEYLQEKDVLDRHPRNKHQSHLDDSESSRSFMYKKNCLPTSTTKFAIGGRHENPLLESKLKNFEKKNFVEQQRSDSPSDAYNCKSFNQTKYTNESQPGQRNFPTYAPGLSKHNDSSQASNKSDVESLNSPGEKTGRQNFLNRTPARNTRFNYLRLQSPHSESKSDYGDPQSPDSHLPIQQDIKPIQKFCEYQTKPSQPNSINHGTGVPSNGSSQNFAQASDTRTHIHKYIQHDNKSGFNRDKLGLFNHGTKLNSYNAKDPSISQKIIDDLSHSGSYSSFSENLKDNGRNIANDDKENGDTYQSESLDEPITNQQLYYASVANFPFGTSIADLFELFLDFDPYNIIMLCNLPLRNRRPTEAIVVFKSEDQVTDAILNFDNTDYYGRVLLVTDATDLSILPELLSLHFTN